MPTSRATYGHQSTRRDLPRHLLNELIQYHVIPEAVTKSHIISQVRDVYRHSVKKILTRTFWLTTALFLLYVCSFFYFVVCKPVNVKPLIAALTAAACIGAGTSSSC